MQISNRRPPAEVIEKIEQATRRFAKRQITWFLQRAGRALALPALETTQS